jgi:hypothetical protein
MGQVISSASVSLDGYIAKADTIGRLFGRLQNGSVEVPTASGEITFQGRPYFGDLSVDDFTLGDPSACTQEGVTHLVLPEADRPPRLQE